MLVGDNRFLDRNGVDGPGDEGLESSVAMVAVDGQLAALVRFRDTIQASARAMVRGLRVAGISELILAIGDHEAAARAVSRQLELDVSEARSRPSLSSVLNPGDSSVLRWGHWLKPHEEWRSESIVDQMS